MKKVAVIFLVLGLAGAVQAAFIDDFDSGWAQGDTIVGSNGWLPYFEGGGEFASGEIGGDGSGIGTTKGGIENTVSQSQGAANTAGLTRYITDDFVNGQLTVQSLFRVSAGGGARLEVAPEENLTTATGGTVSGGYPENYIAYKVQMNSDGNAFWGTSGGGNPVAWDYGNFPGDQFARWNPGAAGWVAMKIHLDLNDVDNDGLTRSAYWSDVDDATGLGAWNYLGEFPGGEIALSDLDVVGVVVWDTNAGAGGTVAFDNFSSTPEPMTLNLLALGAGLTLLRRRR